MSTNTAHDVTMMVRSTCGSCARVERQIRPICEKYGATLTTVDVDSDLEKVMEYGDRVPVILIDGDEFACWEVDNEDLVEALSRPQGVR